MTLPLKKFLDTPLMCSTCAGMVLWYVQCSKHLLFMVIVRSRPFLRTVIHGFLTHHNFYEQLSMTDKELCNLECA